MTQHDFVIDNADGFSVRTDFNAAVQALVTCSSGTVEPATKYPGMLWLDLTTAPDGVLRQRNQGNTAWMPVLLPPDFRFAAADMYFGARVSPNRIVWNDKADGSGNDIMTLRDDGLLTITPSGTGTPVAATDVVTKGYVDTVAAVPVGTVIFTAAATLPINYLKANGASLLRSSYPALFTALGTLYGAVDASHFNVPDLRGEFVRGWDDARGIDAGRTMGSAQASSFASHTHTATAGNNNANHTHTFSDTSSAAGGHTHTTPTGPNLTRTPASNAAGSAIALGSSGVTGAVADHTHAISGTTSVNSAAHSHVITVSAAGSTDTRPRNVAQLACIKYQ